MLIFKTLDAIKFKILGKYNPDFFKEAQMINFSSKIASSSSQSKVELFDVPRYHFVAFLDKLSNLSHSSQSIIHLAFLMFNMTN